MSDAGRTRNNRRYRDDRRGYDRRGHDQRRPGASYAYDGNAARKIERQEKEDPMFNARRRRQKKEGAEPWREREPGRISLFAVAGFFVTAVLLACLVLSYSQRVMVNDELVSLNSQMSKLKEENAKLLTQYELAYDLQSIEKEALASGTMVKLQSSQVQMLSLAEPDQVEYYREEGVVQQVWAGIQDIFSAIGAYF